MAFTPREGGGSTFLPLIGLQDCYEHKIFLWEEEEFWGCPCPGATLSNSLTCSLWSEQPFQSSLTHVGTW